MNLGSDPDPEPTALIAALRRIARPLGMWRAQALRKAEVVFDQDAAADAVFVLQDGLVKLSYRTDGGDEWVKSFVSDAGVFAPQGPAGPASYAAVCLEPSQVVRLPMALVSAAMPQDADLRTAFLGFSAWLLRKKQLREAALLGAAPEARYLALLRDQPLLVGRLPQGDIARYLGITPVAFSRIKRRLTG